LRKVKKSKMKEVINFIVWQWNKWEFWQKCFICSCSFIGASLVAPQPYAQFLGMIPMGVVFVFTFKWWVWDGAKEQWIKYKTEKQKLFTTIKDSEKV